jgi:hypothetical protein
VDKSVNAGNNLSKGAEGHQAYNRCLNNIVDLVLVLENLPGVVLIGFVSERDTFFLGVYALDINIDFVAKMEQFAGGLSLPQESSVI